VARNGITASSALFERIVIGVATVSVMTAVGRGSEEKVIAGIRSMGTNLISISAKSDARVPVAILVAPPNKKCRHLFLDLFIPKVLYWLV
jgi:ABC-type antimicrobial peptide transport system permease subunit